MIAAFYRNRSGATAIEYSMIGVLIAVLLVSALGVIGTKTTAPYNAVAQAM